MFWCSEEKMVNLENDVHL
ncbi:hypothetical protein LINPERHAP1_LOCUS36272 [Linum perenne]